MKKVILLLLPVLIFQPAYTQENLNQTLPDTLKPDYRNHLNIPEYDPSLMPLERQTTVTGVWTELNPKVPRVDYLGIHFVNKHTGWAVGAQGAILKSTDGGESWQNILSPITTVLTNVHSFNGQVVVAVGYGGKIIRSTDSGINWQQIASGTTGDLWRVQMINDTLGWACGSNSFLIRTTDAGVTWNPIYTGISNVVLQSLDFFNNNFGCVVGGNIDGGVLLKTTNGGQNWEEHNLGEYSLVSIEVFDTLRISTGGFTRIFSTLNGGDTWATTSVDGGVNTIAFADSLTGFAGLLQGTVWKTTNGGVNWQIAAGLMPACGKYWIMFPDDSTGFTAGTALNLIKTTNKGLQWKSTVWNDDFNDVEFIDETKGFVISAKLYKTVNGGLSWNLANGPPGGSDILFLDSTTGFIGNNTSIYKTTDGGNNWYIVNGISSGVSKIFFINSQFGWAIGGRNIYKTIDGGENWIIQFTHPSVNFTSIYFIDSLYGWATIISSRPFKTTDGGISWIQQTNLDIWESRDVLFNNYLNGFLLESNKFYKTTNEGLSWTLDPSITGFSIAGRFSKYLDSTIFIIGYRTFRSLDAGLNWIDFPQLTGTRISGLSLLGKGYGFAVGDLGLILKYNDDSVPVELTKFIGTIAGKTIQLDWSTSTETNNLGFEIERKRINDTWEKIGFVYGKGTTTQPQLYSYSDENLTSGKYLYRLKQIDFDGTFEYSDVIEMEISSPAVFNLFQNYPNPFNPETSISYNVSIKAHINISLFNITGEKLQVLIDEEQQPGYYTIKLKGGTLSSGIYFYRLFTSSGYTAVKKLTIIK